MSNSWIKEWYNRFKDGHTSVDSEPRSGRHSTNRNENIIEQVRTLVMEDHRVTVQELANEIGVSIGSGHSILTEDLGMRRAPYSPEMAPCDFRLFPKLKMALKETQFESREDIMRNATARLINIPKDAFQKCFQQWRKHWEKCVHYQGDYFEGD
ncbi:hypothetical protein B7P43_G07582 [Cryptotermes secundus]|uniref:Mos1 transposase HTH domain-containing protein n=1 Tax=Cryptotermes secundus TaxID=105785 RepID=A0A2J7QHW2_9NEOP|nr:hypothetical protein B7P43_G07582 [Cryptotermes secundus]